MSDFRDLKVWVKSHQLALDIYRLTATFPRHELYGITSQMRRASVSIPANLAEGCGRGTQAELAQYAQIVMGSASELEYQIILAHDLNYLNEDQYQYLTANTSELRKMLNKFIQRVRSNQKSALTSHEI